MAEVDPVFQDAGGEMYFLEVEACDGVSGYHVVDDGIDGVVGDIIDGEVHLGGDVEMAHIEEAALGSGGVLTGLMVIGGEAQITNLEMVDGLLLVIVDVADLEGECLRSLLLHDAPLALQVLELAGMLAKEGLLIADALKADLVGVVEGEADILQRQVVDVEGHV